MRAPGIGPAIALFSVSSELLQFPLEFYDRQLDLFG